MRLFISLALIAGIAWGADEPGVATFRQHVNEYYRLRHAAIRKVGAVPNRATPEQIEQYEMKLAAELRSRRAGAKQGDIFSPEVRPLFLRALHENFAGPANKDRRDT